MALAAELHPQRAFIDESFLANKTLRAIQAQLSPPLSVMALQRYRAQVIRPAVCNAAMVASICKTKKSVGLPAEANLTKEVAEKLLQASPFRQRLESLWVRTDKALNRAESAVRVVSVEGAMVAVGADLSAMAPLLNQAHKNVELQGHVTGELGQQQNGPSIAIQINVPAGSGVSVRAQADEGAIVEVG